MTIPAMTNCDHSGDGWCLDCVRGLSDELQRMNGIVDDVLADRAAACAEESEARAEAWQLRRRVIATEHEVCQALGAALGYPRYADDPADFPGATAADGVCVGGNTAASLAAEAADRLAALRRLNEELAARVAAQSELLTRRAAAAALDAAAKGGGG